MRILSRMGRALVHEWNVLRSWFERRRMRRRFPDWADREAALTRNARCAACGYSRALQGHLMQPPRFAGQRVFDDANLLVLCMGPNECHLRIGHGGKWTTWNPRAREDAADALQNPARRVDIEKRAGSWRVLVVGRRSLLVRLRESAHH